MSALDKLLSLANARETDRTPVPAGALSYGDCRQLVIEILALIDAERAPEDEMPWEIFEAVRESPASASLAMSAAVMSAKAGIRGRLEARARDVSERQASSSPQKGARR